MNNALLSAVCAPQKEGKIPKKIHYIWIGKKEKPQSVLTCIDSWKKFCPDYEIIEWNEDNFDISSSRYASEAYEAKKYAFVTDYMRLVILKNEGGIYLDTDIELRKNLDRFLSHDCFFGFENQATLLTALIGAKKDSKYIDKLLIYYSGRSFKLKNGKFDTTTNVISLTAMTKLYYDIQLNNTIQTINACGEELAYYPSDYFCAKDYVTGKVFVSENTYAVHHFNGSWLSSKNKFEDKLVLGVYKLFGEKIFRKIMRKFLLNRIKGKCKSIKKAEKKAEKIKV